MNIYDPAMEFETNTIPASVKAKLKEAYAAGTIYDVVLKDNGGYSSRILGTFESDKDGTLESCSIAFENTVIQLSV